MKKTFFLLLTGALALSGFYAFTNVRTNVKPAIAKTDEVVLCATGETFALPKAKKFRPEDYKLPAVMVRKNVYSLSAAEITSLKAGITAMKALPISNPTSWLYQAAIHGTTAPGSNTSWNSCEHGTQFFLSWHRMYLYFFERILRAKSGNPNLTLPYWDYQTNAALHPDYRNSAASNPLYDATRSGSINGGGSLPAGIMTSIDNALDEIPFSTFQGDLEGPHGSVHVSIGGNMGSVSTAGKDPCFWLHHTNIDRLWEKWIKKCGGRANPNDAAWLAQTYTFFDENGTAVNMTGTQVVNTAATLDYRYDFPASLPCNFWKRWKWIVYRPFRWQDPFVFDKIDVRASFIKARTLDDANKINNLKFNFSKENPSDRILVELNKVKLERMPEGAVEVYVNLPANVKSPNPKSIYFAGMLDLFSAAAHQKHTTKSIPIRVNISKAVSSQKLQPSDLKKMELTFFVRGNTLKGKEIKTSSRFSAETMDVVIEKAVEQ